jgi:hypothetical protein
MAIIGAIPVIGFFGRWLYHKIKGGNCSGRDCSCTTSDHVHDDEHALDPLDPG